MKRTVNRALAILLSLAMLMTLLPAAALAAGETTVTFDTYTFETAETAMTVPTNAVIKSVSGATHYKVGSDGTITAIADGLTVSQAAGTVLTFYGDDAGSNTVMTMTVLDPAVKADYPSEIKGKLENSALASAASGTITLTADTTITKCVTVKYNETITLDIGTFTLSSPYGVYTVHARGGDKETSTKATLTILGTGKIANTSSGSTAVCADVNSIMTIGNETEGPTVYCTSNTTASAVKTDETSVLTINNGKFYGGGNENDTTETARSIQSHGVTTINGGTFCHLVEAWKWQDFTSTLTISGGEFKKAINSKLNPDGSPAATVLPVVSITGGSFLTDPTGYLAAGYQVTGNNPYVVSIKPVQIVETEVYYLDLPSAILAATEGQTVKLFDDVALTGDLTIDKNITIDGGNHKITVTGNEHDYDVGGFHVTSADGVTFKNISFDGLNTLDRQEAAIFIGYGATGTAAKHIKIENCTFTGWADRNNTDNGHPMAVATVYGEASYVDVTGCTFTNLKYGMYFNAVKHLTVSGNHFNGTKFNAINIAGDVADYPSSGISITNNTMENISFGNYSEVVYAAGIRIGRYVDTVSLTDNTITMLHEKPAVYYDCEAQIGTTSYPTLLEAIAAGEGKTIKLLKDILLSKKLTISKSLTLDGNGNAITGVIASADTYIEITGGDVTVQNLTVKDFGGNAATVSQWGLFKVPEGAADGVKLTAKTVAAQNFNRAAFDIRKGTFELDGCTIDCANNYTDKLTKGVLAQDVTGTIKDTEIFNAQTTYEDWNTNAVETWGNTALTITGCTFGNTDNKVKNGVSMNTGSGASTVSIENTTIVATDRIVKLTPKAMAGDAGTSALTIKSGTYTGTFKINQGEVSGAGCSIQVRGGSFSADPTTYLASGYRVTGSAPYVVSAIPSDSGSSGSSTKKPATTEATTVAAEGKTQITETETKLVVDNTKLDKAVTAAKEGASVVVTVPDTKAAATAELAVKDMEAMAEKQMVLEVKVGDVSYELPTAALDTKAVIEQLGATDTANVPVSVTITKADETVQAEVKAAAEKVGAEIIGVPTAFQVTASYEGKSIDISRFDKYVQRVIEVTEQQAKQIATAIVQEDDGSLRHVPTRVVEQDGKWLAKINSRTNSTYALIANKVSFADAQGTWYEAFVTELASRKVIDGVDADRFDGDRNITRAEFAAILVRALGLPANGDASMFSDVASSAWYAGAVGTACEYGIASGRGYGKFAPDASVSRQDAMLMLRQAARVAEYPMDLLNARDLTKEFKDLDTVSDYAAEAMYWNLNNNFIVGSYGRVEPQANITRAECATVVLRLLQKAELIDVRV